METDSIGLHERTSAIGPLVLAIYKKKLCWIGFGDWKSVRVDFQAWTLRNQLPATWTFDAAPFTLIDEQIDAYFAGKLFSFDCPVLLLGTPFQKKVWQALQLIGYGETTTYGDIAAKIGQPKASRAVGGANNKNPLPLIIPCHRVIGRDGSLTGYGGGLTIKRQLLDLEHQHVAAIKSI